MLKKIIEFFKKFRLLLNLSEKYKLVLLAGINIITAFLEVLTVSMMLPLVMAMMDSSIIESNALIGHTCAILGITSYRHFIIICILTMVVLFIAKNLILILLYSVQSKLVYSNKLSTQQRLFHAFFSKPYEYFLSASSPDMIAIVCNDVNQAHWLFMMLLGFVSDSIIFVSLVITILVIDPLMTFLIIALLTVLLILITKYVNPVLSQKGEEFVKYNSSAYGWLMQSTQGIKDIKISKNEAFFEKNFFNAEAKCMAAERMNDILNRIPRLLIELGLISITLLVVAFIIWQGRDPQSMIPSLSAFVLASVKLMPCAAKIVNTLNSISYASPSVDRIIGVLKNTNEAILSDINFFEHSDSDSTKVKLSYKDSICFDHITYSYPNSDRKVLDDVSFDIPFGSSVGIIGRSGAGKTTSVDVMLGLLNPDVGTVRVDGIDVMNNYSDWLNHIGYIPQSVYMIDGSIRENIIFGYDCLGMSVHDITDRLDEVINDAQLSEFVSSLPDGFDTQIGERGIRISGGQKQRLGIARALFRNPDILVFDEATSSLDLETESNIINAINQLHGKKTMVIIAHRLQTTSGCDIIYRVKNGKVTRVR